MRAVSWWTQEPASPSRVSVAEPSPGETLRALRRLFSDNTALAGTLVEEIAGQLVAGGYLQQKPSLTLTVEMLDILEDGGLGLRSPALQPCALEFFWDDEAGRVAENMDLSLAIDWIDAPTLPEPRTLPEKYTHAKSPPCTDLIRDPAGVLRDPKRRPGHVCGAEFLRQSTEVWAQARLSAVDSINVYRWASMYPLPIGRRALMMNPDVTDPSEWAEVFEVLPFDGFERAAWALHAEQENSGTWNMLDLFSLGEHDRRGSPIAGPLAHLSAGTGTSLLDVLTAVNRWWEKFRGIKLPDGRPKGSGRYGSREDFEAELRQIVPAMRVEGVKITQESVAQRLCTDDRTLRRWCDEHGLSWKEIKDL